jgi:hypothetical protein
MRDETCFYLEPRHGGACRKEKARPTPATRQDDISKFITKTLRKRLRDELDRGVAEANATVCGYLFAAAKAGNIPAIIFWLNVGLIHFPHSWGADRVKLLRLARSENRSKGRNIEVHEPRSRRSRLFAEPRSMRCD